MLKLQQRSFQRGSEIKTYRTSACWGSGKYLSNRRNGSFSCSYWLHSLFEVGGRWDSNPRHSEPQSDALTNWTTSTIYMLLKSFSGAKVREKFEFHKFFSCFFEKHLSTQRQPASIKITIYFWKSLSLVSWNFILLSIRETSVSSWFPYCKIIEINQFRGSCLTIYLHVFALGVAILFLFMLSIGS